MEYQELLSKHRKESRDLIATTTNLKKQATKKTRREILEQCSILESILRKQQQDELIYFEPIHEKEHIEPELKLQPSLQAEDDQGTMLNPLVNESRCNEPVRRSTNTEVAQQVPKRRNRQKERLEKRKLEIERIKEQAAAEAADTVDCRQVEMDSMSHLLTLNGLEMFEIKPDGHCLFALIQDQLKTRHNCAVSIADLRRIAAEYIASHSSDFDSFLFDEDSGEIRDITEYVQELASTAMWGSDMEILALGRVYDCPVDIFMASGNKISINSQGTRPTLILGYYKHSFGLGEHYNSLHDAKNV